MAVSRYAVNVSLVLVMFLTSCTTVRIYYSESSPEGGTVKWAEEGKRSNLVASGYRSPRGLGIDPKRRKLYVTDPAKLGNDPHAHVEQMNLDGTARKKVYSTGNTFYVEAVAVDARTGVVYFTNHGDLGKGQIWSAREVCSTRRPDCPFEAAVWIDDLVDPRGLAIDSIGGKVYWASPEQNKIYYADVESATVQLFLDGLDAPFDVELDSTRRKIYWTSPLKNHIARSDLDEPQKEIMVSGLGHPSEIKLDLIAKQIYVTEMYGERICRSELDSSSCAEIMSGLSSPAGLSLTRTRWLPW